MAMISRLSGQHDKKAQHSHTAPAAPAARPAVRGVVTYNN